MLSSGAPSERRPPSRFLLVRAQVHDRLDQVVDGRCDGDRVVAAECLEKQRVVDRLAARDPELRRQARPVPCGGDTTAPGGGATAASQFWSETSRMRPHGRSSAAVRRITARTPPPPRPANSVDATARRRRRESRSGRRTGRVREDDAGRRVGWGTREDRLAPDNRGVGRPRGLRRRRRGGCFEHRPVLGQAAPAAARGCGRARGARGHLRARDSRMAGRGGARRRRLPPRSGRHGPHARRRAPRTGPRFGCS